MKKVLSLLLASSSLFSMQLSIVKSKNKSPHMFIKPSSRLVPSQLSLFKLYHDRKWFSEQDIVEPNNQPNKMSINPSLMFVPSRLGSVELYHDKQGFSVCKDKQLYEIKKHFTDPIIRDLSRKQLKYFLETGYVSLNQTNDGREYSLKANTRVKGGGPVLGVAAYWITKSLCYLIGFAAIGGTVVTTGGAAVGLATYGVAAAGGVALTGAAVTTTAAATIGTTAGVVAGSAAAGAAIGSGAAIAGGAVGVLSASGVTVAGMSAGAAAATTTAAAVTATGGIAATVAGVEAVSMAVGSFFGMLPTP